MREMRRIPALFLSLILSLAVLPATAQEPYEEPDDSWISIAGTVVSPTHDTFMLDYGDGLITVEMDDFDSYSETVGLLDGDDVVVYGIIDDGLYEARTIEASSVYNDALNTYFYANSADEEDAVQWDILAPVAISRTTVMGTVLSVNPEADEFTISTGRSVLTVETGNLSYNPLDDYGYQQIDVGDRIRASGVIDNDFLEGYTLMTDSVISLTS